jgi:hypothetical protein
VLLAARAPVPAVAAAAALAGFSFGVFETFWQSTLQREIPPASLARVSSYDWFGAMVASPVGFAVIGTVGAVLGVSATMYLSAVIGLVISLAVLSVPEVRALRDPGSQAPGRSAAG